MTMLPYDTIFFRFEDMGEGQKDVVVVKCSHVVNCEITSCFRDAVSEIEFPDYCRIITTPIDLKWDGIKML
jgi:hypothetical protein